MTKKSLYFLIDLNQWKYSRFGHQVIHIYSSAIDKFRGLDQLRSINNFFFSSW